MQPARRLPARLLPLAALAILVLLATPSRPAHALAEGDVTFHVTQSPPGGSTVQVGSEVTFTVTATVNVAPVGVPLFFELDYPSGLTFVEGYSTPSGVTCTDNTPSSGTVRCDYGNVSTGPRTPLTLRFTIAAEATTSSTDARMRAGASDGAPDSAADGDDSFTGAGTLNVFAATMFTISGTAAPSPAFEHTLVTATTTIQNNSGVATGPFAATVQFPGASVTAVACSSGSASLSGNQATCTGASLASGETLTVTADIRPDDTPAGSDVTPLVSAPALGIVAVALPTLTVHELGLQRTSGAPAVGSPITVCTADIPNDVPNTTAAGKPQPNDPTRLIGTSSGSALLQTQDFTVTSPSGTLTPASASGCDTDQSGVTFSPSEPGTYTVTARYNTGGTNVLAIDVPGSTNPAPVLSAITPTSAVAGSGPLTLTLTGSDFVPTSEVRWNGSPLASVIFVSPTTLTAIVPAASLANPGTAAVTVHNPAPGGGTSAPKTFTITSPATKLAFTTQPGNGVAGQPLATQPVVAVQTAAGATVTSDNTTVVTLAISGGATLTCTGGLSKTVTAGLATFTGCVVTPPGTGYTITATAVPTLTPATSEPFDVTAAPPTATSQLAFPAALGPVPRSRLTFRVESGTLAPTQVRLTIRRTTDGKYWNAATATWQDDPVQNPMSAADSARWELAVTGPARRAFVNTTVTIEAFATAGANEYRSAATLTIAIR